jgi:methionine synthase I (cobalamin-dependent)
MEHARKIFYNTRLSSQPLVLDGALGSLLQEKNLFSNDIFWSSKANLYFLEEVTKLHQSYFKAGTDIITINTFRTNSITLIIAGITNISETIKDAVQIVSDSKINTSVLIASSSPLAEDCYQIERTISYSDIMWNHQLNISTLMGAGCNFILNETQNQFDEIKFINEYCGENSILLQLVLFKESCCGSSTNQTKKIKTLVNG